MAINGMSIQYASLGAGLLKVLLPWIAAYGVMIGVILSRFAIGFFTGIMVPTNYMTARSWALESEREVAIPFMYAGGSLGSLLLASASSFEWGTLLYISGTFQMFCAILIGP